MSHRGCPKISPIGSGSTIYLHAERIHCVSVERYYIYEFFAFPKGYLLRSPQQWHVVLPTDGSSYLSDGLVWEERVKLLSKNTPFQDSYALLGCQNHLLAPTRDARKQWEGACDASPVSPLTQSSLQCKTSSRALKDLSQ